MKTLSTQEVGKQLSLYFDEKSLSQADVAERYGVAQSWVARIYAGQFTSRSKVALKMCKDAKITFTSSSQSELDKKVKSLESLLAEIWEGTPEDADFLIETIKIIRKYKNLNRKKGRGSK